MLKRTLVANRGEIACRILRACREAGIEGVAIFAENDSGTLFTEMADFAVKLEGTGLAETYLNQEQILQIAIDNGCDSIHPGFGFLSERADFARAVMDAGMLPSNEVETLLAALGRFLEGGSVAIMTQGFTAVLLSILQYGELSNVPPVNCIDDAVTTPSALTLNNEDEINEPGSVVDVEADIFQ